MRERPRGRHQKGPHLCEHVHDGPQPLHFLAKCLLTLPILHSGPRGPPGGCGSGVRRDRDVVWCSTQEAHGEVWHGECEAAGEQGLAPPVGGGRLALGG